tara:strand:+ start:90 stop:335 length:246 start_codon:yes stop_codon:yes gene_type:complete
MEKQMKTIKITEKEFNSIQPHTGQASLKVFALFNSPEGVLMELEDVNGTMNWLISVIRELPHSVSKDVISVLDKVFFISNK